MSESAEVSEREEARGAGEPPGGSALREELAVARSQGAALEQLLEVHEQTSLNQATRLEESLHEKDELLERERAARQRLEVLQRERDAAEEARARALAEAQQARSNLQRVFMQAPAAICATQGPEHVIIAANPLYQQLVGRRDLVGRRVRDAFPDLEGQPFFDKLDQVYHSGEPFVGNEIPAKLDRAGDGKVEPVYLNFVYQPLLDADAHVFGIMVHAVDVTEQVRARQEAERVASELRRTTEALARTNQELDQFAYVASHDLKAPLRGIANLAQWLEEDIADNLSSESREHMDLLRGRVHRMEALIDGILTFSRAGRVRGAIERVDVARLVAESVELLAPPAETRVEIGPAMPCLDTERVPLQQVFLNLIGNAIKYNRRPGAHVDVYAQESGDCWEFRVSDNGPGIAPEFHEKIWQIFQTLEARDKVEGTGIGLSVVKKIVETRGGRISVESALGEGSTFRFTWRKQAPLEGSR